MFYIIIFDHSNIDHQYVSFVSKDNKGTTKFLANAGIFTEFSTRLYFPEKVKAVVPVGSLNLMLEEKIFGTNFTTAELMLPNTIEIRNKLRPYIKQWRNLNLLKGAGN